eukprot:jgi/Botrbrau1/5118/Bobra.0128s0026.1
MLRLSTHLDSFQFRLPGSFASDFRKVLLSPGLALADDTDFAEWRSHTNLAATAFLLLMLYDFSHVLSCLEKLEEQVSRAQQNRRKCIIILHAARQLVQSLREGSGTRLQNGREYLDLLAETLFAINSSMEVIKELDTYQKKPFIRKLISAPGRMGLDSRYDEVLSKLEKLQDQVRNRCQVANSSPQSTSGSKSRGFRIWKEKEQSADMLNTTLQIRRSIDEASTSTVRPQNGLDAPRRSSADDAVTPRRLSGFRSLLERSSNNASFTSATSESARRSPLAKYEAPIREDEVVGESDLTVAAPSTPQAPPGTTMSIPTSPSSERGSVAGLASPRPQASDAGDASQNGQQLSSNVSSDPTVVGPEHSTGKANNAPKAISDSTSSGDEEGSVASRLAPWLIDYKDLHLKRPIGEGSLGSVHLGRWQETDVAVKLLISLQDICSATDNTSTGASALAKDEGPGPDPAAGLRGLEREVTLWRACGTQMWCCSWGCVWSPHAWLRSGAGRGSLYACTVKSPNQRQPCRPPGLGSPTGGWLLTPAKGMLQLHQRKPPILHRDLKRVGDRSPPNLLVDKQWRCKVADFNLSRQMDQSPMIASITANNPRWLAPEVITHMLHSRKADMFAFGIVLWELLTWELPWEDMGTFQIIVAIAERRQRPEIPANPASTPGGSFSGISEYIALIKRCWAEDPRQRPLFDQVIGDLRQLLDKEIRARAPASATAEPSRPASLAGPSARSAEASQGQQSLPANQVAPQSDSRQQKMAEQGGSPQESNRQPHGRVTRVSPFEKQGAGGVPVSAAPEAGKAGGSSVGPRMGSGTSGSMSWNDSSGQNVSLLVPFLSAPRPPLTKQSSGPLPPLHSTLARLTGRSDSYRTGSRPGMGIAGVGRDPGRSSRGAAPVSQTPGVPSSVPHSTAGTQGAAEEGDRGLHPRKSGVHEETPSRQLSFASGHGGTEAGFMTRGPSGASWGSSGADSSAGGVGSDASRMHSIRLFVQNRADSIQEMVKAQSERSESSTRLAELAEAYAQLASMLRKEGKAVPGAEDSSPRGSPPTPPSP